MSQFLYLLIPLFVLTSCNSSDENTINENIDIGSPSSFAKIVSVTTSGIENNYNFSVGILSPDTGCEQYANWWEVISEDGTMLIFRRILGHSHVNEQPFVRSGSAVEISNNQIVIIRAHMNISGYGSKTFKGSVASGFSAFTLAEDFATDLASEEPLPTGCAF